MKQLHPQNLPKLYRVNARPEDWESNRGVARIASDTDLLSCAAQRWREIRPWRRGKGLMRENPWAADRTGLTGLKVVGGNLEQAGEPDGKSYRRDACAPFLEVGATPTLHGGRQ